MVTEIKANQIEKKLKIEELTNEEKRNLRHPKNTGDKDDSTNN